MTAKTCPAPGVFAPNGVLDPTGLPGGCTRDLVHRYYQEQYQLNGGKQNRYVTGSDAVGLTMGYYDTRSLPDLQVPAHPPSPGLRDRRRLLPGGVRRLVPQPPVARGRGDADLAHAVNDGAANDLHSVVDANGMPTTNNTRTAVNNPRRSTTRRWRPDGRRRADGVVPAGRGPSADAGP